MRASLFVLFMLSLAASGAQIVPTHPRIWLTGQMISDMKAKKAAADPDWTAIKASTDDILSRHP